VVLSELSEPQPDIALLKPRPDFYRDAHPRPSDVLLLVEVADTTVGYDRLRKLPLYARAGIDEYWIVNLPDAVIEVYRVPSGEGYRETLEFRSGDSVAPEAFPDVPLDAAAILGTDRPA
jgi:Uma2 family endonuclease